jgi:hypothetical protein
VAYFRVLSKHPTGRVWRNKRKSHSWKLANQAPSLRHVYKVTATPNCLVSTRRFHFLPSFLTFPSLLVLSMYVFPTFFLVCVFLIYSSYFFASTPPLRIHGNMLRPYTRTGVYRVTVYTRGTTRVLVADMSSFGWATCAFGFVRRAQHNRGAVQNRRTCQAWRCGGWQSSLVSEMSCVRTWLIILVSVPVVPILR